MLQVVKEKSGVVGAKIFDRFGSKNVDDSLVKQKVAIFNLSDGNIMLMTKLLEVDSK